MSRSSFQGRVRAVVELQGVLFFFLCCHGVEAQIVFSVTDLPVQIGNNTRAYFSTNVALSNLTSLLGRAGGPQRWNFSQPRSASESIHRTDIVPPNDGNHGGAFPCATYAEWEVGDSDGTLAWRYHRIDTNGGRIYYGFCQPVDLSEPVQTCNVFSEVTLDLPASVQYGQRWSRTVDWTQFVSVVIPVYYHYTAEVQVDAYGTLVLPGLGEVPALRLKQLNRSDVTAAGIFLGTQYNTNYAWLVPGIGLAVQVIFHFDDFDLPAFERPHSNTVTRVFEVRPWGVADLRLQQQGAATILHWRQETRTSGYRVEFRNDLNLSRWELLAEPATNVWSDTSIITQTQRFFRVYTKP